MSKPTKTQADAAGFRKAVPPEPTKFAQCRNCKNFRYDDSDYMTLKGDMAFRKTNLRCAVHQFSVSMGTVCESHEFQYANRGDR